VAEPPHRRWFGHLRPTDLGAAEPPQAKRGGWPPPVGWFGHLRPPLGLSKNKILSDWPKGGRTTPWATGGGSVVPILASLGRPNHPLGHRGWFGRPLGQTLKFPFGPRGSRTTPWATGGGLTASKQPAWVPFGPRGGRTTPWATRGGSAGLGVAEPPQHIFWIFSFFLDFFFLKKNVMGVFRK
jgi:hypothetical protein